MNYWCGGRKGSHFFQIISQCKLCQHYQRERRCEAFPEGIPEPIWENDFGHREEYPGDRGIRYAFVGFERASEIEKTQPLVTSRD